MKHYKKWIAVLLALVLAMSSCVAMAEEALPTQWDLTEIYADEEAWQADYDRVMELIPQHESYRGTLNTAQGIYDYFQFCVENDRKPNMVGMANWIAIDLHNFENETTLIVPTNTVTTDYSIDLK